MKNLRFVQLYESDDFAVVAVQTGKVMHGIEIVRHGPASTITYLTGAALAALRKTMRAWQREAPPASEVEECLAGQVYLGPQYPFGLLH